VTLGIVSSLIMPSESMWRRASFEMQSSLMRSIQFSPFSNASAPSTAMVGYAALYLLIALGIALYNFQERVSKYWFTKDFGFARRCVSMRW
jgi:hypothetical protein